MNIIEDLGFTKEELQEKVIQRVSDALLSDVFQDEEGEKHTRRTSFQNRMRDEVKKNVDARIDALFQQQIAPRVVEFIEGLTLEQTNQWGEKKGEKLTFIEYLTQRADAYMREQVNYDGKSKTESGGYSWSGTQTRITHLVHHHLHYSIERAMKEAIKNANSSIAGGLEAAVKIKLQEVVAGLKVTVEPK